MQNCPLISVIIPVYNSEKYLKRCLESVIKQSYRNLEIIIVNDGSEDHSLHIIEEFQKIDSRVKLINKKNGGLSSARNRGIKECLGEFILHVDSDDWIEQDMCKKLLEVLLMNNAQIAVCDVFFETDKKTYIRQEPYSYTENFDSFFRKYLFHAGLNSVWNKLLSSSLYKDNNLLHYEDISLGEDSSTLLRLIAKSDKIVHINKPFYHYNMRSLGMSRGIKKNVMQYYEGILYVEKFYMENSLSTYLFPFVRFKVAYSELVNCSLKKAYILGYSDYKKLAKLFIGDIKNIKRKDEYKQYKLKYKIFIAFYEFYYFMVSKKYR